MTSFYIHAAPSTATQDLVSSLRQLPKGWNVSKNPAEAALHIVYVDTGFMSPGSPWWAQARKVVVNQAGNQAVKCIPVFIGWDWSQVNNQAHEKRDDRDWDYEFLLRLCALQGVEKKRFSEWGDLASEIFRISKGTSTVSPAFDVFVAHSGVDKNFAREVYQKLTDHGIPTFFDERCMLQGLEIKEVAAATPVFVLVLSNSSVLGTWPMDELRVHLHRPKPPPLVVLAFHQFGPEHLDWHIENPNARGACSPDTRSLLRKLDREYKGNVIKVFNATPDSVLQRCPRLRK